MRLSLEIILNLFYFQIKSEVIATYALCGFANFGSIGIMLGGLGALAPLRKSDLSKMVVRAMICGNVACFLTACVAGIIYGPNHGITFCLSQLTAILCLESRGQN